MKKLVFLLGIVCLFAFSAFAQTPNFAGEWSLDKGKSTMSQQQKDAIESQTMKVEQTDKEIKSTVETKRVEGAGGPPGGGGGGGMGGGRGPAGPTTYTPDGKEVVTTREFNGMTITTKTTAKFDGGKLSITSSTVGPDGTERISKATWELSADGKTLTVKRTQPGRDGAEVTTEMVYTKK